jgi:hypothetical protein
MTAETRMNRILLVEDEPLIAISERKNARSRGLSDPHRRQRR